MGQLFSELNDKHEAFIRRQKLFFVGTAGARGTVNVSPKGMDFLRVLNPKTVVWLNLTGSGNETAAHVQENGRMTLMFCALEGKPWILRLYGHAEIFHERDLGWQEHIARFPKHVGARQIFALNLDRVQTSCGYAVPLYDYVEDRALLTSWAEKKRQGWH